MRQMSDSWYVVAGDLRTRYRLIVPPCSFMPYTDRLPRQLLSCIVVLGTKRAHCTSRRSMAAPAARQLAAAAGGLADEATLSRNERLEVDDVQQRGLDDLGLQNRPGHPHQRLVREDDGPLRHGLHVAREGHVLEEVEVPALE